ncbi:immunoglobulin domain-containing protein [Cytophagaceae bacterium ABcell3]|nr:immunoglobulin domain-containing protein [Cytophagaceae bacterium ABcell3]
MIHLYIKAKNKLFLSFIFFASALVSVAQTPVDYNGKLKLVDNQLSSECGNPVQLRGMSTHGPQWYGLCVTEEALDVMQNDWGASIFRLAMYVESGGYLEDPEYWRNWIDNWVDETGRRGMYCMIDWHILSDGNPLTNLEPAKEFWEYMSSKHAGKDHVLYEICNEPNGPEGTWENTKAYAEEIIPIIRANDPETVIMVGTPNWSGTPWDVIGNELEGDLAYNVMYSFHFYSGTHGDRLNDLSNTLSQIPIFATEWGTSAASGDGGFNEEVTNAYMDVFNGNNPAGITVSWCNWSWTHKDETSAALTPGSCDSRDYNSVTQSGELVKYHMQNPENTFLPCTPEPNITSQPQMQIARIGESASFSVSATGEDLNFQWQRDGEDISGATSRNFTIEEVSESDFGEYTVVIYNSHGTTTSTPVQLRMWQEGPYHGAPVQLPGRIQAQDYDIGGQDVSYYDTSPGNTGGAYRDDDVDIEVAMDSEGSYNVGWTEEGEWLNYSVEVTAEGTYDFEFRVASNESDKNFSVELNGETIIETVDVPNTGGWQTWQTITINDVELPEGEHILRIRFNTDAINLNYFDVTTDVVDCNGDMNGTAAIDDCGECAGGNTGIEPGYSCSNPTVTEISNTDQEVLAGDNLTLEVTASGPDPISYQWYKDGSQIEGANESTYTIESATEDDAGVYHVVISNDNGDTQSDDISVTFIPVDCNGDPEGTAEIDECDVCAGGNTGIEPGYSCSEPHIEDPEETEIEVTTGNPFTLEIIASGPEPLSYQWYKEDEPIEGATESTFNVEDARLEDAGIYYVIVSNDNGETRSPDFEVTVNSVDCNGDTNGSAEEDECGVCAGGETGIEPGSSCALPEVEDLSASETEVNEGDPFTLEITASGPGPHTYQWYRNGEPVEGATESTYTVNEASADDKGSYYVVISNENGSTQSNEIDIHVNLYDCNGDLNGTAEIDECDVCAGGETGIDPGSSCLQPEITSFASSDTEVNEGDAFTLEVVSNGTNPLSYQWFLNGTAIEGANESLLTVSNASEDDAGAYHVVVSNEFGEDVSEEIEITINVTDPNVDCNGDEDGTAFIDDCNVCAGGNTGIEPNESCTEPEIEQFTTTSKNVNEGDLFTLEVIASGPGTLSYRWYHNDILIEGADESTYTVENATLNESGSYFVIVSSEYGAERSSSISINVLQEGGSEDCNGDEDGTAFVDDCGVCAGGNTGIEPGETCEEPVIENISSTHVEVTEGESTTLEVTASGPESITYQWFRNGDPINGATASSYTIENADANDAGTYHVEVYNNDISTRSDDIEVIVNPDSRELDCNGDVEGTAFVDECGICAGGNTGIEPGARCPEIISMTSDTEVTIGEPFSFNVSATGSGSFTYQWYKDDEPIEGATDPTYAQEEATEDDAGTYYVVIRSSNGAEIQSTSFEVSTTEPLDCHGTPGGDAYEDVCGNCVGGETGEEAVENEEDCVTSINAGEKISFNIYPNPATSELHVEYGKAGTKHITVYNNLGSLVLEVNGNDIVERLDVSNLPAGIYHLILKSEDDVRQTRFVVQ